MSKLAATFQTTQDDQDTTTAVITGNPYYKKGERLCNQPVKSRGLVIRSLVAGCSVWLRVMHIISATMPGSSQQLLAQSASAAGSAGVRKLYGDELQKAREIRDQADLLAASFIDRFRWSVGRDGKPSTPAPTSDVAQQDYRAVVEAYRQVGEQYPNTEIAAYAMLRLSGFFQYRRENDLAIRTAEKVAEDYSRSHHENMAYFMAGMIELQSRHQPQAAIEWLKKIRRPSPPVVPENDTPRPPVDQETQLYIAAQQQIARAEQMIGKGTLAQARVEQLGQRYPHYADYAKERLAADQKAFLQSEFGIDLNTMFNDSVLATLELANVSGDAENPLVRLSATAEHSATNAPPTARTAVPTVPSTPSAIEHSSLGLWLGLGVCIIGVSLLGAGIYLHFLLRKEQQ